MPDEELGKAQIPIRATLDKLDGDLEQARKKVESSLGGTLAAIGNKVAAIGKAVVIGGAVAAAAAVAGIGVAAFNAGMQLDEAYDKIQIGTGATGRELGVLKNDFAAVFKDVPADAETVSGAIAALNSRLGATGAPLQEMARGLVLSAKLMGGDATANAESLTRVMGDWSIKTEDGAKTLDKFFVAQQKTGAGMDSLMQKVVQFGSPLRLMGFSLDESIALFGKWEKEGVNAELVMGSLRIAAGKFAKEGQPLRESLLGTFDAIKNNKDATAALAQGMEVFGARAGPDMVAAIREGRFAADDLVAALAQTQGAIENTAKSTEDWPEKWQKLKNVATVALAPLGLKLMEIAGNIMEKAGPALEKLVDIMDTSVLPVIDDVVFAIQTLVAGDWDAPWDELFASEAAQPLADAITGIIATVREAFDFINANLPEITAALGVVLVGAFMAWAYSAGLAAVATITALSPVVLVLVGITAAVALLAAAWAGDWLGIRTTLTEFWTGTAQPIFEQIKTWLEVNIPAAIAVVSGFWTGTLLPAMQAVGGFISGTVIPIFNTVAGWLGTNIPAATAATSGFWTGTLLPALSSVWSFLSSNVIGIFTTVRTWLQTTIPAATQTMSGIWQNTLLPAITAVWTFLQQYIIPIFTTIVEVDIALLNLALQALAGFWEKTLKPALETVWEFINGSVIPILKTLISDGLNKVEAAAGTLADFWENTLNPAIKVVTDFLSSTVLPIMKDVKDYIVDWLGPKIQWLADAVFGGLKSAINDIKAGLQWFIDKLKDLKELIASIKLPDWLTPGSPTPLELGIIGINAALREMNGLWGEMGTQPAWTRAAAVMPMMPTQPMLARTPAEERVTVEVAPNGGETPAAGNTYNIYPSYRAYESESDLLHTVRLLQMAEG